ncbi:MAG: glycogen synthase GlgA [Lautropia sp.]|nr:glycogen synthase GlgA [Lautropia sp.]
MSKKKPSQTKTAPLHPRVLHVAAEVFPLLKTGGLADVAAALPAALRGRGVDARLVVPGFPAILAGVPAPEMVAELGSAFGAARVRLLKSVIPDSGVPVYIVDAPWLYRRPGNPYLGPDKQDWPDNTERFALFGWVAAQLAAGCIDEHWQADILHAHDWHAALAPAYLRARPYNTVRTIYTIHNLAYQGLFPLAKVASLGLPEWMTRRNGIEFYGQASFMKAGLVYADRLTTVSPRYAYEITTKEFGVGLEGVLFERRDALSGILNGIDEQVWNPEHDHWLNTHYTAYDLAGKAKLKAALQADMGLNVDPAVPLAVMVSRLTDQKGADLLLAALPAMRNLGMQLALIGSGNPHFEEAFRQAAELDPGRVAVHIGYDEPMSHRLIAGGDIILVPSRFEPCGLTQMYGLRYGTLPVVRNVGGLSDTVVEFGRAEHSAGNGFVFNRAELDDFVAALSRAASLWQDGSAWHARMLTAMGCDNGWSRSAEAYVGLYRALLG